MRRDALITSGVAGSVQIMPTPASTLELLTYDDIARLADKPVQTFWAAQMRARRRREAGLPVRTTDMPAPINEISKPTRHARQRSYSRIIPGLSHVPVFDGKQIRQWFVWKEWTTVDQK